MLNIMLVVRYIVGFETMGENFQILMLTSDWHSGSGRLRSHVSKTDVHLPSCKAPADVLQAVRGKVPRTEGRSPVRGARVPLATGHGPTCSRGRHACVEHLHYTIIY